MKTSDKVNTPSLFEPPGGILIWLLIIAELLTFALAFWGYFWVKKSNENLFFSSQKKLDIGKATINTLVLLSSSYTAYLGQYFFSQQRKKLSAYFYFFTVFLGVLFLAIKYSEFSHKLAEGLDINKNIYYSFYWGITTFHALHVAVGVVLLLIIGLKIYFNSPFKEKDMNEETGTAFWHMCDLIWVFVFANIYLL